MRYSIIPPHLSIKAMRSSGYKDTAYALAELIDNSIQAGESLARPVEVEVICIDRSGYETGTGRRQLDRIAVYDNASGMSAETLRAALQFGVGTHLDATNQHGIGKFGMGLPNSSISQCRRVDVWSWQEGIVHHSYLDIGEIENGVEQVPEPSPATLPSEWIDLIRGEIGDSGTLVVWSILDLVRYKQSTTLLRNAEFLVGRIYRYFVNEGTASIRLASYERNGQEFGIITDSQVRPNDPLFLMTGTVAPPPYDEEAAFELFGREVVEVTYRGVKHDVTITGSISKPATRLTGGGSAIGKQAKKNLGVSVVRAKRELELSSEFENTYDPRERWWGLEVSFEPALDEVFGVTNNKQAATEFRKMDLGEDAEAEGESRADFAEKLQLDHDPRLVMYEISKTVDSMLATMRKQVNRMRDGERNKQSSAEGGGSTAESIATRALRRRQQKLGETGVSDREESAPEKVRTVSLAEDIQQQEGIDETTAHGIAVDYVSRKLKFRFRQNEYPGFSVFDVTSKAGLILITINTKHPAHAHLFDLLSGEDGSDPENPALQALELLLTAWARMEDEASPERKEELEDIRGEWGRIARDFLREAD